MQDRLAGANQPHTDRAEAARFGKKSDLWHRGGQTLMKGGCFR